MNIQIKEEFWDDVQWHKKIARDAWCEKEGRERVQEQASTKSRT